MTNITTKIQYAFLIQIVLAFGFVKLSIIYFYRRLFVTGKASMFDLATRISIGIVVLWTIAYFFGFIFGCGTHFSANWGSVADEAYCKALLDMDNSFVVSDVITDVLILCLPLPVVCDSLLVQDGNH